MLNGNHSNLELLVQELLLARTEGMAPQQVAAFVDGWSSLLGLLRRTDLTLPDASAEARAGVEALVRAIENAQRRVLEESPEG
jgi:hypothetical protein